MDASESPALHDPPIPLRAKVVYLDQNKWIELAQAAKSPKDYPVARDILEVLCASVEAGSVRLPLTSTNIYETHKVNRREQRWDLAYTQTTLSKGEVFRGSHRRLEVEIGRVLSRIYDLPWIEPFPDWVFSKLFFEATAEAKDPRLGHEISDRVLEFMQAEPQRTLLHFLMNTPEQVRQQSIRDFTQGCETLRVQIEERRERHKGESISMRRKIYSVLLVMGEQDVMISAAIKLGLPWNCFMDRGGHTMRDVVRETPAFLIEREISLRLEAESRPIHLNDMRDMRTFATVLPYSDVVVAEKPFINLARQAGLHTRFGVQLETDLRVLKEQL
jgi:hypothetical protein